MKLSSDLVPRSFAHSSYLYSALSNQIVFRSVSVGSDAAQTMRPSLQDGQTHTTPFGDERYKFSAINALDSI